MTRAAPLLVLALTVAAVLLAAACGPSTEESAVPDAEGRTATTERTTADDSLQPLPALDLSAADAGAREQLETRRAEVQALLDAGADDPVATAEALAGLGLLYLTYEFLDAAGVCFDNARHLDDGNFRWQYLAGYLAMIQGRLSPAIEFYGRTLELEPEYLPAVLRLGRSHLEQGEPEEAARWFERALELDPSAAAAHAGLGRTASASGDSAVAVERFGRALELDPEATALHYALAQAYRNLGDLDRARYHLESSGDVNTRIADPLINPLANLAESAQFYIVQGAEAMDDRDFEAAAAAFRSAVDKDAADFSAHRGLAMALERLGDAEGAVAAYKRALEDGATGDDDRDRDERAGMLRALGLLAAAEGQDAAALVDYQQSLALRPNQPDLLLRLGNALARQRRFDEAIEHYDRLIELQPEWRPAVLEKRATALVNLGRGDEAIADFEAAVESAPNDPRLRLRFAEALDFLGHAERARGVRGTLEGDATDGPAKAALLADRARGALGRQDFANAAELFAEAVESTPDNLELRFQLASVLGHLGRFDDASKQLATVLEAAPRHEPARRSQIIALLLAERYGPARVALQDALRTFPRHVGFALVQVRLLAMSPAEDVRDGALALEIAQRVAAERQDLPTAESLALALAAAGRTDEAAILQRRLIVEAEAAELQPLVESLRVRLTAFEAGRPWVAQSPDEILQPLVSRS